MVVKLVKKITEWSYSRYKDWKQCPLMAKFKHVDKLESKDTYAQAGGSSMHELAEEWASKLTSDGKPSKMKKIPEVLKPFEEDFAKLRSSKIPIIVERDVDPWKQAHIFAKFAWGLTKSWKITGFFVKDGPAKTWGRMKVDTHWYDHEKRHVQLIDYKSGRIYPDDHAQQCETYAIGAFEKYPEALTVTVEMWYIDQCEIVPYEYFRKDLPKLKKLWDGRLLPMLSDGRFTPRPGKHCTWCSYGVSKGGTCEHG